MTRKKIDKRDVNERREDALKPNPYLGYDRDALGLYLLSRGAYKIAEGQFRRAVWLNPFEYRFVCHLAWCLYRQERREEAKACIDQLDLKCDELDEQIKTIIDQIKRNN